MPFPPDAKLTLEMERFILGSGYYLHTKVITGPTNTDPVELEPSLLVRLNTNTQPDALARVCSRTDLEAYPEVLYPVRDLFELTGPSIVAALGLGSIVVGDDVIITCPDLWQHINPLVTSFITTVAAIGAYNTSILVVDKFPAPYDLGMDYVISSGMVTHAAGSDAIAQRYNLNHELYCRVKDDYTRFDDLSEAINKLNSVKLEAQGLVNDYETSGSSFEGDETETFT